jgi:Ni,Fe-hydrogenase maturation factor
MFALCENPPERSGAIDLAPAMRSERDGSKVKTGDPVARQHGRGRNLVLAIGNSSAGDDGFGPAVLAVLGSMGLPEAVDLADGGILGVDLLSELEEFDRLIVIDAVRPAVGAGAHLRGEESAARTRHGAAAGRERGLELEAGRSRHPVPGGVVVFRLSEVELEDPDPRFSLHDLSFGGCLRLARILELRIPEITVVGYAMSPSAAPPLEGAPMSGEAAAAVPVAAAIVRDLLLGPPAA